MIPDARPRLEDLLDREIELARVLAATLAAEKTALTGDSPVAVEKNAADKIRVLMAGCRIANEVNGHIIHVRRHQIRQLIDIVRGGPSITYDPQGKTFAKALRALARA
jgi:flagellar biosynthesis/type III secretory pathway chaperone